MILLDADLQDMEATHLLGRLLTQVGDQVPIIVLSSEPPSRRLQQNGHHISYLPKPFAAPALLTQVRQALGELGPDEGQATIEG